jgi:hypothetical protein
MTMRQNALFLLGLSATLAGCSSVPSYYSQRMSTPAATSRAAVSPEEENPPRAADARRRRAARSAPDVTASTPSPAATADDSEDAAKLRSEQRERAIQQRMQSICSGC